MNLGQIRDLVWQFTDDPNGGYFTESLVNRFINNSLRTLNKMLILAGQNQYLIACPVETSLVVSQNAYALPLDFMQVNRLSIVTSGVHPNETEDIIYPITENQQDLRPTTTGTPEGYIIRRNVLWLFPTPNAVKTMRLSYHYRAPEMTSDTMVPDLPEEYHEALAVWAACDCFIKDDRQNGVIQEKRAQYEDLLKRISNNRRVDKPRMVVTTQDMGHGAIW